MTNKGYNCNGITGQSINSKDLVANVKLSLFDP